MPTVMHLQYSPEELNNFGWFLFIQDLKNIKNVKKCRDGMPKSMQTR